MNAPWSGAAGQEQDGARAELSRRGLLLRATALAALGVLSPGRAAGASPAPTRARRRRHPGHLGTVLGAGLVEFDGTERNVFCAFDLDDPEAHQRLVTLDFYGHGMALDPRNASRLALFQKAGKGACEIDLAAQRVVRPIETAAERQFYGHGAFSPDGALLYATETVTADNYRGVIVLRDGQTLAEVGEFPSFGAAPHDCVLRDGGATLVVTNGGGRRPGPGADPCVTYVDVPTQKLLERVEIGHPDVGAGHLALTSRGDLAVVSAARWGGTSDGLGAVGLRPRAGRFRLMADPAETTGRMRGEALSLAIHEPSRIVGVTSPFGGLVTFWSLESASFVKALELSYPHGIATTLDGSRFVISYGRSMSLLEVSTDTLEPLSGSRRSGLNLFSSHIVIHGLA